MTEAKIKSEPDPDLPYRKQTIRANNKTLITPIKSIDPKHIDPSIQMSKKVVGLNEMYGGLTSKKIADHLLGTDKSVFYQLNSAQRSFRNPGTEMQFCFLEFKDVSFPSQKEVEFITDQAYVHSDITPIPMLSDFTERVTTTSMVDGKMQQLPNEAKFEKFLKYLKNCIDTIQQLNNKPIMGYVPDFRFYFKELIDFYVKNGINTFYYDTHLSSPMTLQGSIRALSRELNNSEALEKSYIHMLNPGYGRASKDSSIIPAKDVLGFGLGIDGLGERHMRRVFNKALAEYMKKNPDNRARLFDKKSYGYIKTADREIIEAYYPNDSGVDIANFLTGSKPSDKIQHAFNAEQLALETSKIKEILTETKPMLNYIAKKDNVKEDDIKILKRAKIKLSK